MKKVFKFVKGKKDEKKESGGMTPSQSGELLSPAQTPEDERFLGLDNSSGYIVDFCGKDKTLTKLHKAAWQGSLEKLKSALKKIEIDAVDRHNRTALHFAVVQGHPNIVWFLLGNNAKTSICDDEGRTPLLKAIECGHKECTNLLLDRGTDINVADYTGNTGLHIATNQGSLDTVSVLLKKGADAEISNNAGDYPLHIATKLENKDLVDSFLENGASVDVLDRENRTPLMLAAKTGNLLLAQLFFERGAQLTVVDSNGWTAHDYALLSGYESVAASLKSLIESKKPKQEPPKPETEEEEEEEERAESGRSNENSGSWSESKTETSDKDPITQKLKEFFKKCSEDGETDREKGEDLSDSPNAEVMPPYCRPPRSWDMIQAGMIDENKEGAEPKRRSITTLGTLHSRRESFAEGLTNTSPKYTLSLNRRKHAKVNNSFAKQRFSFNEEESLKYWISQDKTIRKDLEKIEMENISSLEPEGASADSGRRRSTSESDWDSDAVASEEARKSAAESDGGTLGKTGTMNGLEEMWVVNPHLTPPDSRERQNSWDSEEPGLEKEGNFPPPPSGLELGIDMAKSIKYMKGISEDHPIGGAMERNLWKNAYESHSLDCLEEKDFAEPSKIVFKGHVRNQSTSDQKWRSEEIPKCQKPSDRLIDVNRRINEQLECYDQALRELAESSERPSGTHNYHSLPSARTGDFDESRRTNSLNRRPDRSFVDSGPFSMPFSINAAVAKPPQDAENDEAPGPEPAKPTAKPGEKPEKKTKRHMLLAMRDIKHAVHLANTFKTSQDEQILSPLAKPEGSFDADEEPGPKDPSGSEGNSPADENPFFGIGRQETVMERNEFRRKSSSSGTGDEPTLWLQDKKTEHSPGSDENISEISEEEATKHKRTSSFSPLGIVYREIQKESQNRKKTSATSPVRDSEQPRETGSPLEETFSEENVREQSPDISLSSGPIEPLGTEKDSGSEPESSHNDVTPTHNYSLKAQHEWLKSHLKAATSEKSKLEEMTAQLSEKTERLQYELADAKEAAKSRDEVIQLLQGQLARMEAAYTKSLEESVQSRLQLTSHEQEILHLKELCYKYEEEKDNATAETAEELESRIKLLEKEKKKMKEEICHLEEEKCSLEKRLKEAADSEIIDQCQRWKERCEEMGELTKAYDSQKVVYETYLKDLGSEHLSREKEMTERAFELEKKFLEVSEENLGLKSKLQSLATEVESERRRTTRKESNESELKRKNAEAELRVRNLEMELEERVVKKLKEKEEEVQGLVRQFNQERDALIMSYEKKMMERRTEQNEQEAENFKRENERLRQMIARLQDQVASIQAKAPDEDARDSLRDELSELKYQCNVVAKSIAEMQNKDAEEMNSLVAENFQLKKEMNELKVRMIRNDGENVPNFKTELLGVVSENSKMKNEIWDLKNEVNSLTALLDRRLSLDAEDRRLQSGSQRAVRKREVGKEDELAWSSLYGIKAGRSRGERSSVGTGGENKEEEKCPEGGDAARRSPLEFLELRKEILSLQSKMSDEKSLRHALESQIVEMNMGLREKETLEQEIHSLKRKIDRDCVQRSEMELLRYQEDLESKRERFLERECERTGDEDYKARCEVLAKEREKFKELKYKKSRSFDPGGEPPTFPPPQPKFHSSPLFQPGVQLQPDTIPSLGLEPHLKTKLEEELDRSIKKYLNESSTSQSIPSVQIELLKQKYFH